MKSSMLFECNPLPNYVHLAFTLHHMISVPRPSLFFVVFPNPFTTLNANKVQKQRRPGDKATRSIAETLQIQTTLHSGHAAVVLMVSALEGINCIQFTKSVC